VGLTTDHKLNSLDHRETTPSEWCCSHSALTATSATGWNTSERHDVKDRAHITPEAFA